ncbi:hypothetical protein GOD71_27315 [Sinorhizobium medicae]|uniref:hypothetical protein n=1 Tax=Rhizobium meliloti TaxID=382 RepID=UPI0012959FFB|nr:hypothetical protein [Sinorhizobium meliloti]MDX0741207.1 hypothetical protein [Sinorhizobium medicae]MQX67477.1 hypothetical protein [Sinorhizobium meliloti]
MKSTMILMLLVALAWTAWRLSDVESDRYALLTGICDATEVRAIECLRTAEPRISRFWDLYYGLVD